MSRFVWIIALLLMGGAAFAEDLSKIITYAVTYGASGPGPTQDLSKMVSYAVITGGAGGGGGGAGAFHLGTLGIDK